MPIRSHPCSRLSAWTRSCETSQGSTCYQTSSWSTWDTSLLCSTGTSTTILLENTAKNSNTSMTTQTRKPRSSSFLLAWSVFLWKNIWGKYKSAELSATSWPKKLTTVGKDSTISGSATVPAKFSDCHREPSTNFTRATPGTASKPSPARTTTRWWIKSCSSRPLTRWFQGRSRSRKRNVLPTGKSRSTIHRTYSGGR